MSKTIWDREHILLLKEKSSDLDIYELVDLFEGRYSTRQINNKITYLGLERKKTTQRRFDSRRPRKQSFNLHTDFFENIDTRLKAYVLGLWVADGHMIDSKGIGFSSADYDLVNFFKDSIGSNHELRQYGDKCWRLNVGSQKLARSLQNLGFDNKKSQTAFYPSSIASTLDPDFIRGVFDGDGCVTRQIRYKDKKPEIQITFCGTECLMEGINMRLPQKAPSITRERPNKNMWVIKFTSRKAFTNLEWIYQESQGMRLERKYQRYQDALSKRGFYSYEPVSV